MVQYPDPLTATLCSSITKPPGSPVSSTFISRGKERRKCGKGARSSEVDWRAGGWVDGWVGRRVCGCVGGWVGRWASGWVDGWAGG